MEYRRIKNETVEDQEKIWKGSLGDDYNERNKVTQVYKNRAQFWHKIQAWNETDKVLEVGCNLGYNLLHFDHEKYKLFGVDVNYDAIQYCRYMHPWINAIEGSVFDLPFKDGWFSLCFTVGMLIHVPPAQIKKAMDEIVRVSGKYVLCAEYWAEKEKERPFLDMVGITFERPFDEMYLDMGLTIVSSGELTKEMGFNELRYFLFKK